MKFVEAHDELEKARLIIYRLRQKSKNAPWFGLACKAIETLISGLQNALDHIKKTTT